ncbi:hypothetical protein V1281_003225 [Nitrobacteraceae bacterium AZCC 2161]
MAHTMSASTGKDEATRRPDFPEELFKQEAVMEHEPIVFVGIDWASTEHQVCLLSPKGPVQRAFTHDALGLGAMVDWLAAQADDPEQVAVAIEMPHGPVVEALMDRQIAVFAINPKQLDRAKSGRFKIKSSELRQCQPVHSRRLAFLFARLAFPNAVLRHRDCASLRR